MCRILCIYFVKNIAHKKMREKIILVQDLCVYMASERGKKRD